MKYPLDRGAGPGEEEMNPVNSLLHNLLCVLSSKKQEEAGFEPNW